MGPSADMRRDMMLNLAPILESTLVTVVTPQFTETEENNHPEEGMLEPPY